MSYLVNGTEYSTKKEATDALFAAAADGEATLALVEDVKDPAPDVNNGDEPNADQPHAGQVGGPAEGPGFVL